MNKDLKSTAEETLRFKESLKHTKGEWSVDLRSYMISIKSDNDSLSDNTICGIWVENNDSERIESEANARLIAAAPKLLEALIDMRSQLVDGGENPKGVTIKSIELAINSAI